MKSKSKYFKLLFIVIAVILIIISLTGNIITTNEGSLSIFTFESFYVNVVAIIVAIYSTIRNKNANISIIISLFTYLWTYYLVNQMVTYLTEFKFVFQPNLYIYYSSALFLIISLFFNIKNIESSEPQNKSLTNSSNINSEPLTYDGNIDKNNFLFTNLILGFKGIPYYTTILLVNNIPDKTVDLIYTVSNNKQIKKIPLDAIRNITYRDKVKVSNSMKKVEENETKSALLSAVVFGGNPLMQLAGNSGFNTLFNTLSNNYDKVNYNVEYEIKIEYIIDNELQKVVVDSENNPELFINQILNK